MTSARCRKFAGFLLLMAPLAAMASAPTEHFTVSPVQAQDALAAAGLKAGLAQIEFLSEVRTASDHAALEVVNTSKRANAAMVKMRCRDSHQCLPFYVLVHQPQAAVKDPAGGPASPADATPFPRLMRSGDPAILILENADYRISLPVVCLQNGTRGQRIRVASKDHRRFFEGEIVRSGLLKGNL